MKRDVLGHERGDEEIGMVIPLLHAHVERDIRVALTGFLEVGR